MPESLEQAVVEATLRVFETSAFMSVWQYQPEDGALPAPDVAARMQFCGPFEGCLTMRVATQVLPILAANMLGEPDAAAFHEDEGRDALKEVLNMICGNLLTAWWGEDTEFDLCPPEIVPFEDEADTPRPQVHVPFTLENTLCEVEVSFFPSCCQHEPCAEQSDGQSSGCR